MGIFINVYKYLTRGSGWKRQQHYRRRARIPSMVSSTRMKGNRHKLEFRKFHLYMGFIYLFSACEDAQTLEEVAQRGYGGSILRDCQNLTGHGPKQPAPVRPALRGRQYVEVRFTSTIP